MKILPTYDRPLIIEKYQGRTLIYFGDSDRSEVFDAYERGNYAALNIMICWRNRWDWLVGFFDYVTKRNRV